MSTDNLPAIEVKKLSKRYKISHQLKKSNTHPTLKDDLSHWIRKPLSMIGAAGGMSREEFWALKDLDFDIPKGQVVGIMGRNGSGKSTLLKILSRITQPTSGSAVLRGRTASLLEVGTGFHPELSGRENIYFNGSILGMSKAEIDSKFNDIIEFSEVEQFLDTPIKFFSSGMRVRLAFSVAANLNPDILIIDEVLAVGDVRFKQKSMARMKEIANSGKTVLFVSHIVGQLEQICERGIVLEKGKVAYDGKIDPAIEKYLELNELDEASASATDGGGAGFSRADISSGILDAKVNKVELTETGKVPSLKLDIEINNLSDRSFDDLWFAVHIKNRGGTNVSMISNEMAEFPINIADDEKVTKFEISIPYLNLSPGGPYTITLGLREKNNKDSVYCRKNSAAKFTVAPYKMDDLTIVQKESRDTPPVLFDYKIKKVG